MAVGVFFQKEVQGLVTSTMDTLLYAGPGILQKLIVSVMATARWFRFYDKATAPVVGDSANIIYRLYVPAGVSYVIDFGPGGLPFNNGLGYRQSTLGIDSDATPTSLAANDSTVHVFLQQLS